MSKQLCKNCDSPTNYNDPFCQTCGYEGNKSAFGGPTGTKKKGRFPFRILIFIAFYAFYFLSDDLFN